MPSDKHGANDRVPGNGGTETAKQMANRTMAFGVAIVILGCVAVWFVATTFNAPLSQTDVRLSAPVEHTVMVFSVPSERKEGIQSMLQNSTLRGLTEGHKMYTKRMGDGRIAICAGRFNSTSSAEARQLLKRVREFRRKDKKPFQSAQLIKIAAEE